MYGTVACAQVKTKECRYAVPADALCKAIKQKAALEKYRQHRYEQAVEKGDDKEAFAWQIKDILEVRRALLADAVKAQEYDVPDQWSITVPDAHAEIGHIVTSFLAMSTGLCSSWLQGRVVLKTDVDSNSKTLDPKEPVVKIWTGVDLKAAFDEVAASKVLKNCAVLLNVRSQAFKLSSVKPRLHLHNELHVAASVLQEGGLLQTFVTKKGGKPGCAATCFAKTPCPNDPIVQMELANILRGVFGIGSGANFLAAEVDESVGTVADAGLAIPVLTAEGLLAFGDEWSPRLRPGYVQKALGLAGTARAVIANALSPSKRRRSDTDEADAKTAVNLDDAAASHLSKKGRGGDNAAHAKEIIVQKDKVAGIRSHFEWVLVKSDKVEIKKAYVQSKIPGFDKDSDAWEVMKHFLGGLGLIKEGKRVDAAGFTLMKPKEEEDVSHVVEQLSKWLGFDEEKKRTLARKFAKVDVNTSWDKKTFDFVLSSVSGGAETLPKVSVKVSA